MNLQSGNFILASSSPRRSELLSRCGLSFEIIPADVEENEIPGEQPQHLVERLAEKKAGWVADANPDAYVLGADTVVEIDGVVLGKPRDKADAQEMLSKLQGRMHTVWGGVAILRRSSNLSEVRSFASKVWIAEMSEDLIRWYVDTEEPMDKAGSYAIQGIGLQFVERVEGSYSNVVGLNLQEVCSSLRRLQVI